MAIRPSPRPSARRSPSPSPARQAGNCIPGRIGKSIYLGENAQYDFVSGTTNLKVLELNPRFVDVSSAAEVFATVQPEDVVVLKD